MREVSIIIEHLNWGMMDDDDTLGGHANDLDCSTLNGILREQKIGEGKS